MKTKITTLVALFFALFMFTSTVSKAQCNSIVNNSNCPITIDFVVLDRFCTPCNSLVGIIIPPGAVFNIPCAGCILPLCDVKISVTQINGVPIAPNGTDWFTGPTALMPVPPCNTSTIVYNGAGVFKVF